MNIPKFLNHSAEFHHIHGSAGNLCGNFVFAFFTKQVLSYNTKKSTHVWVWFDHLLESLHLIDFDKLVLQLIELGELDCCELSFSAELVLCGFWSLLLTRQRKLVRLCFGLLCLLLSSFLLLVVLLQLSLEPDHLLPNMHQTSSNMRLSGLPQGHSILHALIRFRRKDLATWGNTHVLLVNMLWLLMISSSCKFVKC